MRQNRRPALWAALALLFLCGCGTDAVPEARRSVALVAKSTETEFWLSAFAGAQAAAAEYNLELTISGPGTEEDYETQNKMIAQAVENGAEGPLYVGMVNYGESSASGQERERGALDGLAESGRARIAAVVNTLTDTPRAQTDVVALLLAHPEINVLIAFNEPISVGASKAVRTLDRAEDIFLVGFDSNVVTIDGLQDGYVDALIVQNPYAMGYLGVESAYKLLTGQGGSLKPVVDTSTQIVDRKNLFTMDGQKALFAFDPSQERAK